MHEWNDAALLSAYANQQSEEAFGLLVERYIALVYSAALRQVQKPYLAEEVTQATFTILAQKARQLGARTTLSGWLCCTAHLVARNASKSELRRHYREQEAYMQSLVNEPEPETWRQLAPLLDQAVAQLSEADRNALVLRFYERKPLNEVGAILRVDPNSAQKRVSRALDKLRKFFARHGVNSTTAAIAENISAHSVQVAPAALAKTVTAVALAKGAVASASTLTLLKGLKIMSWTKAKTAAVVAVVAVLGTGAALFTINAIKTARIARLNNQHDIQGVWEGNLSTGPSGVSKTETAMDRMVLKLSKTNGRYTATADLVDLGRKSVPVAVDYAYPTFHLSINPQNLLNGWVDPEGTQLHLGGSVLQRTSSPDGVPDVLTAAMFAPRPGSDLQGYWKGTIDGQPAPLPVIWKIAEESTGTFRAELDNPNQGAMGQPATVIYDRPSVRLILTSRDGMVQGEINSDDTEIKGSWIQGGRAVPASFKRADYEADHAQDSIKDYSYHSDSDLQGHWEGSFLLQRPAKFPIVLDLEIAKMPDGTFSATVASIYHWGHDGPRPASDFQYAAPNLHITWQWMNDQFEGTLKKGRLTGLWINGGKKQPIVFERKQK
jgi:RNA polymerase sigma factor (sigma-70 family)